MNYLFLGDCLNVLRNKKDIPDDSIYLIYIDPPFNSKRNYNIFFDDKEIQTQRIAFEDTWTLKNIQDSMAELHNIETEPIYELLQTYQNVAPHAFPYLVMMALRIIELHRVLKKTGSFYLHCDPAMSHYLKTLCDLIFGHENFQNEIIWRRTGNHNKLTRFGPIHDVILFFTKSNVYTWNHPKRPYMRGHIEENFIQDERGYKTQYYGNVLTGSGTRGGDSGKSWKGFNPTAKGRHWAVPGAVLEDIDEDLSALAQHQKLDRLFELGYIKIVEGQAWPVYERYLGKNDGQPLPDIWAYQPYTNGTVFGTEEGIDEDIRWLSPRDQERWGYPTQKPKALLERIITASSNEGDTVLDGFGGCGTTIDAAEGLKRNWIGIDISPIAISLIKRRINQNYGNLLSKYSIRGVPSDEQSAMKLWEENPNAFQDWWCTELGVFATTYGKKGADKGVDGIGLYSTGKLVKEDLKVAFQVKGGKVQSKDVDALIGAMFTHKCQCGVFLSKKKPSKPMLDTIGKSGFVKSGIQEYPKLQFLTLEEYFSGKKLKLPKDNITLKYSSKKTDQELLGF